ncbi:MAG: tetratricopeptide repeat protein, partial [Candidatus Anstonellales archaeon]
MGIEKAVKGAAAEAAGKATDTKETQKPQSEWNSYDWCDYGLQKLSFWKQYGKKSDLDEAIRAFKKALELDPSNKKAKEDLKRISQDLYLLGMQAYANGDYKTAIEYFKQALELDKNNEKARDGLAKAEKMERFGE